MDGYKEASIIDDQINNLLLEQPITPENALQWLRFARTISTGLAIVEEVARQTVVAKSLAGVKL